MNFHTVEVSDLAEVADGKHVFGTVKVGERGQRVIPKEARKSFEIKPRDIWIVTGDKRKAIIIILKANAMKHFAVDFVRATRKSINLRKNLKRKTSGKDSAVPPNQPKKNLARECVTDKAVAYAAAIWVGVHCNNLLGCGFFSLYYLSGSDYS